MELKGGEKEVINEMEFACRKVFERFSGMARSRFDPFKTVVSKRMNIRLVKLVNCAHEIMIRIHGCGGSSMNLIKKLLKKYSDCIFVYRSFNRIKIMMAKYSIMIMVVRGTEWLTLGIQGPENMGLVHNMLFMFNQMICSLGDKNVYIGCVVMHKINSVVMIRMTNTYLDLYKLLSENKTLEYKCRNSPFFGASVTMDEEKFEFTNVGMFDGGRFNFMHPRTSKIMNGIGDFMKFVRPYCVNQETVSERERLERRQKLKIMSSSRMQSRNNAHPYKKKDDSQQKTPSLFDDLKRHQEEERRLKQKLEADAKKLEADKRLLMEKEMESTYRKQIMDVFGSDYFEDLKD